MCIIEKMFDYMSIEEKKDAPVEEPKKPADPADPAKKEEEKKEPTIKEALGTAKTEPKGKENLIPEAAFLEEKKGRKEAERKLKELEESIKAGATKEEISEDLDALAEEYGIDKDFLKKFEKATTAKAKAAAKKELEDEAAARRAPVEEKEKQDRIDTAFKKGFGAAMEKFPELKGIVKEGVIKTLSLDPANADKTFSQLIEETYGDARSGKRTIENPTPRGGKEPGEIDFDKARKNTEYFKEIMADPELKKKYNAGIEKRINL